MDLNLLNSFIEKLPKLRTLVVGDLMLDEYLWGSVERISPEAPVQVVDLKRSDLRLGGAGNVVNNLRALGCQVQVASVIGADENADLLRNRLAFRELNDQGVLTENNRLTSRKTRILANNQQIVRVDSESRESISNASAKRLIDFIKKMSKEVDLILISDYQKGVLTDDVLVETIQLGRKNGIPVIVDPKGEDFSKYRGATLLTPNRKELKIASGSGLDTEDEVRRIGQSLVGELQLEYLALTRSEEGISVFSKDAAVVHLPAEAREVYDVTGAGDTVMAILGVGLALGLSIADSAWMANIAAGIVVGKVGASTVTPDEILAVAGKHHADSDSKIKNLPLLLDALDRERKAGRKIVFTNGCFDLLHVGHVKYLQKARKLGDCLVLGLNSDDSIRRLKGPNRPLICEKERAHILAALDCIDHVVLFDEDTPYDLISTIKPDVLAKGEDYVIEDVVGRDVVESYGGRVELVRFEEGKSTTNIIKKILDQYGND
ncbi:MAG: bifunctional heptose 7-phosphate kinase/heptose 1-phosphate adenyltransferase [Desulfuromonas sp.]|nr:MAG: bifunctional heptose 7-phosphate kinase/heptose 1-phosphate adenyltransferase [Desulfuromonas sp.]